MLSDSLARKRISMPVATAATNRKATQAHRGRRNQHAGQRKRPLKARKHVVALNILSVRALGVLTIKGTPNGRR